MGRGLSLVLFLVGFFGLGFTSFAGYDEIEFCVGSKVDRVVFGVV